MSTSEPRFEVRQGGEVILSLPLRPPDLEVVGECERVVCKGRSCYACERAEARKKGLCWGCSARWRRAVLAGVDPLEYVYRCAAQRQGKQRIPCRPSERRQRSAHKQQQSVEIWEPMTREAEELLQEVLRSRGIRTLEDPRDAH